MITTVCVLIGTLFVSGCILAFIIWLIIRKPSTTYNSDITEREEKDQRTAMLKRRGWHSKYDAYDDLWPMGCSAEEARRGLRNGTLDVYDPW